MLERDLFISVHSGAVSTGIYYGVTVNQRNHCITARCGRVHSGVSLRSAVQWLLSWGGEDRGGEGGEEKREEVIFR